MYSIQSSSASRSSTAAGTTSQSGWTGPPLPAVILSRSAGVTLSPTPLNLSRLKPEWLLNPSLLSPMIMWLAPTEKDSGSTSASSSSSTSWPDQVWAEHPQAYAPADDEHEGINRISERAPKRIRLDSDTPSTVIPQSVKQTPAPPSTLLASFLVLAAECVHKHALSTPILQRRDAEIQTSLAPFLPDLPSTTIRRYAFEDTLLPLEFDKSGMIINSDSNQLIWTKLIEFLLANDPDKELFQLELATTHGRNLLDSIVHKVFHGPGHQRELAAFLSRQPQAKGRLQLDFELLTRYLTHAQCVALLNQESAKLEADPTLGTQDRELISTNICLFIDAIQQIRPEAEKFRRIQSMECRKAELFLLQSKAHLNEKHETNSYASFYSALQIYCRLKEKRRVIQLMTQLIVLCKTKQEENFPEIFNFFCLAKNLCLTYPVDLCLYAQLLFVMDGICRKPAELKLLHMLYQHILADHGLLLPDRYRAKILHRKCLAEYRANQTDLAGVHRVWSTIEYYNHLFRSDSFQHTQPTSNCTDLSKTEFLHNFAYVYQLAANLVVVQIDSLNKMNPQRNVICLALIKNAQAVEDSFDLPVCHYASLQQDHTDAVTRREKLMQICANYCRKALKVLLTARSTGTDTDTTESTFVSIFGALVNFFVRYGDEAALDDLLARKNVIHFMHFAEFKSNLPGWRRAQRSIKEQTGRPELVE